MSVLAVITVVKDDPAGLTRTLTSLAAQGATGMQLMVVDGSTDRAEIPALLAAHPELPVEYSWHPPQGVYAAMNVGLTAVARRYVYFLNAGDVFASADVVERIERGLQASAPLWAFGRVRFVGHDGATLNEPRWSYRDERARLFARGRFPAHQGVVVNAEALSARGGFDLRYRVAADYASILSFAREADPLEFDFTLAEFTTGGLSTQQWQLAQREFHRARREVFAPTGAAALRESLDTVRGSLTTRAYRTLWAPGRPFHRVVANLRGR